MTAEVAERALTRLVEAEKVVKAAGALRGYIEAAIPFLARELLAELDAYEKSRPS